MYWSIQELIYTNNNTHSPALQCITYIGSSYHSWPLDASAGGYIWLSTAFSIAFLNMSRWPYVVLLLTIRCLCWGYVWLSTAFSIAFLNMSRWPHIVLLLATRCLYWGVHLTVHCLLNCIPQHVKMTLCSIALGHQMPLLGGYVWLSTAFSIAFLNMSRWPHIVLLLATRCLYWGYVWLSTAFSIAFLNMSRWPYVVLLLATRCL